MYRHKKIKKTHIVQGLPLLLTALGLSIASDQAEAYRFDTSRDWQVNWDNTLSYTLGVRVEDVDDKIGNNPVFSESDYRFPNAGDIVTNRISNLTEFDIVYQRRMGFRASASMFKDFAYNSDRVKNNPDIGAPGSYEDGRYDSYAKRNYRQGVRLLDAFAFANFDLFGEPSSLRFGRTTQYWGNALFFGSQGINYGQNASDGIKGMNKPGTEAKELSLPRTQLLFETALSRNVSLAAQYFFEYMPDDQTTGGTYLGAAGFLYRGPDSMFGTPRGSDHKPKHWGFRSDYGLRVNWRPDAIDGVFGLYYREFAETQPWAPIMGPDNYHLSYADNVKLLGLSYERSIGAYSVGFETSYRKDTALASGSMPSASDPHGREGARGDTLHVLANIQSGLSKTALYDTGFAQAEIAYTRRLKTTKNSEMYNGVNNEEVCPSGTKWAGCATDNSASIAVFVGPQWLSVFPGVDITLPLFVQYGLYGQSPTVDAANAQGSLVYTAGISFLVNQKYDATLQYNGYKGRTKGAATGPAGDYHEYMTGVGFLNDRDWVSLTLSTTF